MARIVIVSGPPGAGKSTVARGLAEGAEASRAVHLHTDDFYAYVRKGFVPPWKPEAQAQNGTIMEALAKAAAVYARDGYEVAVDGIVGPWFLDPWREVSETLGLDLRYVVLIPSEEESVRRACARTGSGAMTDAEVVRTMWRAFQRFAPPAANVVDSTGQPAAETVAAIQAALADGRFRLDAG